MQRQKPARAAEAERESRSTPPPTLPQLALQILLLLAPMATRLRALRSQPSALLQVLRLLVPPRLQTSPLAPRLLVLLLPRLLLLLLTLGPRLLVLRLLVLRLLVLPPLALGPQAQLWLLQASGQQALRLLMRSWLQASQP